MASTPKVILVIGSDGLERAHILHAKGEADLAIQFYRRLIPTFHDLEKAAQEDRHGKQRNSPRSDR